jgi:hypothetical protein
MLGLGARIMAEAGEREIDSEGVEKGERLGGAGARPPGAVGDLVTDLGELGGGKVAGQLGRGDLAEIDVAEHIGIGDFLAAAADLDLDVVIAEQEVDLLVR